MQEQVDALGVQFAEEVEQVDQRPTQAIDPVLWRKRHKRPEWWALT
jgi:hypothetical protein